MHGDGDPHIHRLLHNVGSTKDVSLFAHPIYQSFQSFCLLDEVSILSHDITKSAALRFPSSLYPTSLYHHIMHLNVPTLLLSLLPLATAKSASQPISSLRSGVAPNLSRRQILSKRDVDPSTLYPAYNLSVPIDHFHNESMYEPHSSGKFNLRYFFDATYYKPGGVRTFRS